MISSSSFLCRGVGPVSHSPSHETPLDSTVEVTLVHGTFAPDAPWTQPGSKLRQTLRRHLACRGLDVQFDVFTWSGKNDHESRLLAGRQLREHLRERLAASAGNSHAVVAHSHGGNVALYALRDEQLRAQIDAVVTLGTPFIHCRPRPLDGPLELLENSAPAAFYFLLVAPIVLLLFVNGITLAKGSHEGLGLSMLFAAVASLGFVWLRGGWLRKKLVSLVRDGVTPWARRRQGEIVERLKAPALEAPDLPLLCCSVELDEAGTWLRWLRWIGSRPNSLYDVGLRLAGSFTVFAVLCVVGSFWIDRHDAGLLPTLVAVDLILTMIGFYIGSTFFLGVMTVFPWLVRGRIWGFGGESPTENLLTDIRSLPLPQDAETALPAHFSHLQAPTWLARKFAKHSALYEDDDVLGQAGRWLAGDRPTPPAAAADEPGCLARIAGALLPLACLLALLFVFRFDTYRQVLYLTQGPTDWQQIYPDLRDAHTSSVPVARPDEPIDRILPVPTSAGAYCALVGKIEARGEQPLSVDLLCQARQTTDCGLDGSAELNSDPAENVWRVWSSPAVPRATLDLPLDPETTYLLDIRPPEIRDRLRADLDVHCWSRKPQRPAVLYTASGS